MRCCRRRRRTRSRRSRGGGGALLRPRIRACRSRSRAWAPRTATGAACRSGTCRRSRRASRCTTRWDPMPYSPIHDDDIAAQLEPLLGAASVPATIVNWCGDEPVSVQEWSRLLRRAARRRGEGGGRRRSRARRVGSVGDHGEAPVDHRVRARVKLARRVPAHGGALPSGAGRRDERVSGRYPDERRAAGRGGEATGLADFGPGDFREGLDVLLESLERDGDLEPADRRRRRSATCSGAS